MSPIAAAVAASSGVYLFAALYYGAFWAMRRDAREHGWFALLAAAFGGFAAATAVAMDAPSLAHAATAQSAQNCAAQVVAFAFVWFTLAVSGRDVPWIRRGITVTTAVGLSLAATGSFFDAGVPDADFLARPDARPIAQLLWPGWVVYAICSTLGLIAVLHLALEARARRDLRTTAAAVTVPFVAAVIDLALHALGSPASVEISALAPLLAVAGIGWALVGRFSQVDAALAERTAELAGAYDELRLAQQELVRTEQLAAVGELSAVIAHEVRNPLAIIRNAVGGLRRPSLSDDDTDTLLAILDEEADRLNRLVGDLLTYAKPVQPEAREVVLREVIDHAIELARGGQSQRRDIHFEVIAEGDAGTVLGDPALLRHALINIVDNAIQAMPEGGVVTVRCREAELDGRAAIAIDFQDEGEGMDTLVRNRARDPFFTTRQTGTGLGLAIVDRVARVHGGRVEIDSRHGQGTTVTLVLPRERPSLAPPATFT